jgi:hypothetical protein
MHNWFALIRTFNARASHSKQGLTMKYVVTLDQLETEYCHFCICRTIALIGIHKSDIKSPLCHAIHIY